MNKTGNKRYIETENKIRESFLILLEHKNFNNISVNDICSQSGISRPSFYTHYDDINDLIIKMEHEKSSYIRNLLTSERILSSSDFQNYLNYVKNNKTFYKAYFESENNSHISSDMMNQYISTNHLNKTSTLRYHMLFFMAGIKAIVHDWLIRNCPESIEEMTQIIMKQYHIFTLK